MTGAAVAKYEWSLNGTVVGATSTYTVPASAVTGDIIAVTVTAEDGETASDSVVVSGLTIVSVEPTTATTAGVGYKYVRIAFSEPLSSLDASEIEIRDVKTKQLFSLESVKLSSTGLFADVTLSGSFSGDGTTFLQPNTPYVATIDHDGMTDSLEFQLPANVADYVVVGVNEDENEIYIEDSGRTKSVNTGAGGNDYFLGVSYLGNVGELLGRTVNFGYDADDVITDLTVQDEVVVIDSMKYVDPNGNGIDKKDYFETNDGKKYYFEVSDSATKNETNILEAAKATTDDGFVAGFAPVDGHTYNFVKLVLNPTGTIATAVINDALTDFLRVASVDDNVVIADKNTSMNFSGYTMFNNEELISTADLEVGDVVYYSIGDQFAYVYNESVTGELDNVIHEKLDLDGTTYTWTNAKYYDDGDSKYKVLEASTDAKSVASQKYLNSLDPDDVTITLTMGGSIAYVDGEVVGEEETTTTTYILTETAAIAPVGFDKEIKLPVNDGKDSSAITFNPYNLKSVDGEAGKTDSVGATGQFFVFKPTDGTPATITKTTAANYQYTALVDVIADATTGDVVGLKELDAATSTGLVIDDTSTSKKINSGTKWVGVGTDTYAVTASTKVWIVKDKTATTADTVKMVKFSDFSMATIAVDDASVGFTATVYPDKSNAKHIVIHQTDITTEANTWETGEKADVTGVVVGTTEIAKGDGSDVIVLKDITIKDATGTEMTLDADGTATTTVGAGDLVTLTYTKSDTKVTNVANLGWTPGAQTGVVAYDSGAIVLDSGDTLRPYTDCLVLKMATVGGTTTWTPITIGEITSSVDGWTVNYHAVSTAGTAGSANITADFVVVEDNGVKRTAAAVTAAMNAALATLTTDCTTLAGSATAAASATNKTTADASKLAADAAISAWETATGEDFDTSAQTTAQRMTYTADVAKITAYETAEAAASSLSITYGTTTIAVGATSTPTVTGGTGWTITYASSAPLKASVITPSGVVTGEASGTAIITATAKMDGYVKDFTTNFTVS